MKSKLPEDGEVLRALDYGRVSTRTQAEEGYSLETQRDANAAFIASMGWIHVDHLEEDASGLTLLRDELDRVREMIANREIDVLVVYDLDRLSRRLPHQYILRAEMRENGVRLWYAKSRSRSGETKEELIGENVLALVAEVEVEKTQERTQRGKRAKAMSGKVIGSGVAPYGYEFVGLHRDREIRVVEHQAETVRLIFRLFVNEHMPALAIAEEMTRLRIPTPGDEDNRVQRRGTVKRHRGRGEWGVSTVYRILRQRAYYGEFVHYRHTKQDEKLRVNQDTESRVVVTVPEIVDRDLFEAAQERIDFGKGLSIRNARSNDVLLARVFKCDCGRSFQLQRTEHQGRTFTYYRCFGRLPAGGRVCHRPYLKARLLDPFVWEWAYTTVLNPTWLDKHMRNSTQRAETRRRRQDKDKERLALAIAAEERRLERLRDMLRDQLMEVDEYRKDRAKVVDALKRYQAEYDAISKVVVGVVHTEEQIARAKQRADTIREGIDETDPVHQRIVMEDLQLRATLEERDGVLGLSLSCILNDEWHPLPEDIDERGRRRGAENQ